MLKKNSFLFGVILGAVITVAGYFAIYYLNIWVSGLFGKPPIFKQSTVEVLAIFVNVFPFRYYMLKLGMDYTGRGILMVTSLRGLLSSLPT
jgi:hypothetical protein